MHLQMAVNMHYCKTCGKYKLNSEMRMCARQRHKIDWDDKSDDS